MSDDDFEYEVIDINEQRAKKIEKDIEKLEEVFDDVLDGFNNEIDKLNYRKLNERRDFLLQEINNPAGKRENIMRYKLQLKDVEESIEILLARIDWNKEFDVECEDEDAAREFLAQEGVLLEGEGIIEQNDALDKLENELYGRKDD